MGIAMHDPNVAIMLSRARTSHRPLCWAGHPLKAFEMPLCSPFSNPFKAGGSGAQTRLCTLCTLPLATSDSGACRLCEFYLCRRCLSEGRELKGGGAFVDVVTPELARELLRYPKWLKYRARIYFHRTDSSQDSFLDVKEMRGLVDRICALLGIRALTSSELQVQMVLHGNNRLEISEDAFEDFLRELLKRLDSPE